MYVNNPALAKDFIDFYRDNHDAAVMAYYKLSPKQLDKLVSDIIERYRISRAA